MLAVLVIMALGAAVAGASIAWPDGGPIRPADEYRVLMLRSQQIALANAGRVTLLLERDGTYVLRRSSERGEEETEAGRIESCRGRLAVVRPAQYVFDPRGLIFGDTLRITCDLEAAIIYADPLGGSIHVEL
jgi:hypothetical protein